MVSWLMFDEKLRKTEPTARTALVKHRWYGPAIYCWQRKEQCVVSCRVRVTKVAPRLPPKGKRSSNK